jgi:hypothetical protein
MASKNEQEFIKLKKSIADSMSKTKLDSIVRTEAYNLKRDLELETPKDSGRTARLWNIKKLGPAEYSIGNSSRTSDDKHNVVDILNDGHGEIRPITAKKLFIPLSPRAKKKLPGSKIPDSWEYGQDYIMTDRVQAKRGTKFMDKLVEFSKRRLISNLLKTIGGK